MKNKKYVSIALLSSIALYSNINSMEKEPKYDNINNGLSQIGNTPYEFLQVFYENVLGRVINDLRDISLKSIREMKKNIQIGISSMPMLSNHINKNLKYDKDYIRKLVTSLIQERLSDLIERNKKDYQGKYKGLSKDELNDELSNLIDGFYDHDRYTQETFFIQIVELILAGVDINTKNDYGDTVLMLAAARGYKDVVELLVASGAKVNINNNINRTALMQASSKGHIDIVRLLIAAGADINISDIMGATALSLATNYGYSDILKLLRKSSC